MKIKLQCQECQSAGLSDVFLESIRDDGFYSGICPNGHKILLVTQTLRHEMLFEIALSAIDDGYFREAVSSFAASAERYYEFAIRVIGAANTVKSGTFEQAWKLIKTQSERQYGAYLFLYTCQYGSVPLTLQEKMVMFRNKVIHQGHLPDRSTTLEFGKAVYEVIQKGIQTLRINNLNEVNTVLSEHVSNIASKLGNQYPRTFMVTTTALNVIDDISNGYRSFETLLASKRAEISDLFSLIVNE